MKKNYRLGICLWASYGLLACTQEVKVYTTSETEIWKQAVVEVQSADGTVPDIVISDEQEQSFDGFGGSFGEIGWDALALLPEERREEVMQALFAPEGIHFAYGRIPMGANDFARDYYTCNDTAGDFEMRHFTIERDKQAMIPYVKAALKQNPELRLWTSPWTPPVWMKVTRHYATAPGDHNDFTKENEVEGDHLIQQPEYLKQLETLPPKLREAWLYGSWDVYEGQFFEDFRDVPEHYEDRQWTHVIEPFAPDKGWTVCRSYDFGYGKPFSCAWWAVDYDGVIYRILELYGCTKTPNEGVKWTPDRQFAEIRRIETEHPWLKGREITGVADPAIWDASRGESVAQTAARYGVYFTPGDNERIAGWMQCHYRLQFDENGYPRMYVFKNCKAFIRTVPLMLYSQTRPEDLDTAMEDHVCDEWRYFCMSRPVKPMMQAQTAAVWSDPLNQIRS